MFRAPFDDEDADNEVLLTSQDNLDKLPLEHIEARSTGETNEQTTTSFAPATAIDQPPYAAEGTARLSLFLDNLPSQTMTKKEIAAAQAAILAARNRVYEPSSTTHTINPHYPIQLNGFQLFNANNGRPPTPNPHSTIARPLLAPSSLLPITRVEEIEALLAPVKGELERLKGTRLPPGNGRVAAKSAMQVLKERLVPVGRYLVQWVAGMEEGGRSVEGDICRYIAEKFWPQDLEQVDGLRIMEIYRNAIYLERIGWDRRVAKEDEKAWRLEILEAGFVDDAEEEMPRMINGDIWRPQVDEEVWYPAAAKEEPWRSEIGGIIEQDEAGDHNDGGVAIAGDGSWADQG